MSLADAVTQRRLLHWHDRGFVRTVEPHLLCQLRGMRLVVIGLQVAGGPAGEPQQCWKVIDVDDGLNVVLHRTFTETREVPPHLLDLVHLIYASPSAIPQKTC